MDRLTPFIGNSILERVKAEILRKFSWNIKAIVVFGSTAVGDCVPGYSDLDVFVITKVIDPFLPKRVHDNLKKYSLPIEIQIAHMPLFMYRKIKEAGMYDIKERGQTVYGNEEVAKEVAVPEPSLIPRYESIRYLFNVAIAGINSVLSKEIFIKNEDLGRFTSDESSRIRYQCYKSYNAACASLLLLKGEYRTGYVVRAKHFKEIFQRSFVPLQKIIPDLDDQFEHSAFVLRNEDFRVTTSKADTCSFLNKTINDLSEILKYCIDRFFGTEFTEESQIILSLGKLPKTKLNPSLYVFKYILDFGRLPPLSCLRTEPTISCYMTIASVFLAARYVEDEAKFKEFVEIGENKISQIYSPIPRGNTYLENWENMRRISTLLLKKNMTVPEYRYLGGFVNGKRTGM